MINIKGTYNISFKFQNMFLNEEFIVSGENIITLLGESFFLNRAINEYFSPIQYIVIGDGVNKPKKTDFTLGHETSRKKCITKVDLQKKQILLICSFNVSEMIGTTEIGTSNGDILISHDVYDKIDESFLNPSVGDIRVEYGFQLSTGSLKGDWSESENNIYYSYEPNEVIGVIEDGKSGYKNVNSLNELVNGSYYYDLTTKNLYIKTTNALSPNYHEIIVQVR